MSGFNKHSALGMVAGVRTADLAAVEAVAHMPALDQALVAKKSELRQSLLAILGAAIEADLDPGHAFDVLLETSAFLTGSAMREVYDGAPVPWGAIEVMGRGIITTVAKGAGRIPPAGPSEPAATPNVAPTHSDHQTRQ